MSDVAPVKSWVRIAIAVPAAVALVVAAFLLWEGISNQPLPGCGAGSDCEAVANSRWARWGPIPVAGPGALVYAVILGCVWLLPRVDQRKIWPVLTALALAAAGGALWFTGLQLFLLKRICPYCMVDHVCGLITAGVILWRGPRPWRLAGTVAPSLTALVVLIGGQILVEPKTYSITTGGSLPGTLNGTNMTGQAASTNATPQVFVLDPTPAPGEGRLASLLEGRVTLNPAIHPILGSPAAQHILVDLFDYTCPHCRVLHGQLMEAKKRYGDQIAVVPIVAPLSKDCNPHVRTTPTIHANACLYARYSLAVWKANPAKYAEYDKWLSESKNPPPIEAAGQRAQELVGAEALGIALADPAVARELANGLGLYKFLGAGSIPKLLVRDSIITGKPSSPEKLFELLEKQLGVVPVDGSAPILRLSGS